MESVPSPDAESILKGRTEECLTPQPTITNNALPVDTTHEELTKEWIEISNCFNIPPDDPSLAMNMKYEFEVSKVLETQQSHIDDNILPMEESKSNVSSSNEQVEHLPENKDDDDELKNANKVNIEFQEINGNKYKMNGGEEYGTLEAVNNCRNYSLRKNKFELVEVEVDNDDMKKKKPVEKIFLARSTEKLLFSQS